MLKLREDMEVLHKLFSNDTDAVMWLIPVFDGTEDDIVDFRVEYCNEALSNNYGWHQSQLLSAFESPDNTDLPDLFSQCVRVWERDEIVENGYYNAANELVSIRQSRAFEGVICVIRGPMRNKAESTERMLRTMLNASDEGIMVLKAIRNSDGQVVDFEVAECNNAAFSMGQMPPNCNGKRIFDLFPGLNKQPQMNYYREVAESGIPYRYETSFLSPDGQSYGWFLVSLSRYEDGVLTRFIDISDKKEIQGTVEKQGDLLKSVLNAAPIGIAACKVLYNDEAGNPDFELEKANEAFLQLTGLQREEGRHDLLLSSVPAFANEELKSEFAQVYSTGSACRLMKLLRVNGQEKWFDISVVKLSSHGIVITLADVSELRKASISVQRQTDHLNSVLNASINGVFSMKAIYDQAGQVHDFLITNVNHAFESILHLQSGDVVGKTYTQVFPGVRELGFLDMHLRVLESGKAIQKEIQYKAEGIDGWYNISVVRMDDHTLVQTFTEITESKKARQYLQEAAEKLQVVLDNSQTGIFLLQPIHDSGGELTNFAFEAVNQTVASYAGSTPDQLVGEYLSDWFPADMTNGVFETYREVYKNHRQKRFESHYSTNSLNVWLDVMAKRVNDSVLVTFHDFTPLKNLQQQQEELLDDLQMSNERLSEFAHIASHDLQEPLRKIHFFSDHLKRDLETTLSAEQMKRFGRLEDSADRMRKLIEDLLAYSEVSRKRDAVEQVDMNDILQQVLNDFEATILQKNALITVSHIPSISGNPAQIRQLFHNLISNSLKYCREGVEPAISITSRNTREMFKGFLKAYCCIEVSDNGIGFDTSDSERIFQIFQRLHNRSQYPGTGIGLAIVQKVVENHDGIIRAKSKAGEGSVFSVYLPL